MGIYAFKLPDIGEGVVEGEVVEWFVNVGDVVKEDQPILSVMTDKATVEIPSPVDGKVLTRQGDIGDILAVGVVCIEFEVEGSGNASELSQDTTPEPAKEEVVETKPEPVAPAPEPVAAPAPAPTPTPAPVAAPEVVQRAPGTKALASPAVRQRAREAGISLDHVAGSGPAGRVSHADLDRHIAGGGARSAGPSVGVPETGHSDVKVIGLRRKIAQGMVASYTTIPHFSYFEEVDVTQLEQLRQTMNASRPEGAPKLTFLPFIMLALRKGLQARKAINGHYYDDERNTHRQFDGVHLGIATQTDRGLYVPVVKHVEAMDIWQAASEMMRVVVATRDGTASAEDLSGSTFTITSLGRDGGLGATPIINKPEVGILGVHKAVERAVVIDGRIEVRRMMNLSSSFDHRVIDGWDGAMLVQDVKKMLENPALIFL